MYGAVAVLLWVAPGAVSQHGPIVAGPMGLRFVGAWAAFLAMTARHAGIRPSRAASRLPVAALVAFPLSALVATLGHVDELRAAPAAVVLAALAALTGVGLSVQRAGRRVVVPTTRGGAVR